MIGISENMPDIWTSDLYKLNRDQFDSLFDTEIDKSKAKELLEGIKLEASTGASPESIDLLLNLTPRNDFLGIQAEKCLFDLYNDPDCKTIGIDYDIRKASKKFCIASEKFCTAPLEWLMGGPNVSELGRVPGVVLYLSGVDADTNSDCQNSINLELRRNLASTALPGDQQTEFQSEDFFASNRYVSDFELNAALSAAIGEDHPVVHVNPAIALSQLADKIASQVDDPDFLKKTELFPLNVKNGHWILFAASKNKNGSIVATFFDSKPPSEETLSQPGMEDKEKEFLEALQTAARKLAPNEGVEFNMIRGDLQEYVPNGCALFVYEAIKKLGRAGEEAKNNPSSTLHQFMKDFEKKGVEEQKQWNKSKRFELLEPLLLPRSPPPSRACR